MGLNEPGGGASFPIVAGVAEANSPGATLGSNVNVLFDSFYDVEGSGSVLPAGLGITWDAGTRKFTFDGAGMWLLHLTCDLAFHATADLVVRFDFAGAGAPLIAPNGARFPKTGLASGAWTTIGVGVDFSAPLTLLQAATLQVQVSSDTSSWSPIDYALLEFTRIG